MPNILYFPLYSPFSPEYIVFFPFSLILVLFSTFSETGMEKLYLVLVFVFINIVLGNLSLTYITVDTTIITIAVKMDVIKKFLYFCLFISIPLSIIFVKKNRRKTFVLLLNMCNIL